MCITGQVWGDGKGWDGKREGGTIFSLSLDDTEHESWTVREKRENKNDWRGEEQKKRTKTVNAASQFQTKDTEHSILPVLSSPLPVLLQSSDCSRLPGNQSPVETVSGRRCEKSVRGESGLLDGTIGQNVYVWCTTVAVVGGFELNGLHQTQGCAASRSDHQEFDGLKFIILFCKNCSILESPWLHISSFSFAPWSL